MKKLIRIGLLATVPFSGSYAMQPAEKPAISSEQEAGSSHSPRLSFIQRHPGLIATSTSLAAVALMIETLALAHNSSFGDVFGTAHADWDACGQCSSVYERVSNAVHAQHFLDEHLGTILCAASGTGLVAYITLKGWARYAFQKIIAQCTPSKAAKTERYFLLRNLLRKMNLRGSIADSWVTSMRQRLLTKEEMSIEDDVSFLLQYEGRLTDACLEPACKQIINLPDYLQSRWINYLELLRKRRSGYAEPIISAMCQFMKENPQLQNLKPSNEQEISANSQLWGQFYTQREVQRQQAYKTA
ncbi:MAG: hypothetical protein WCW33_02010 [Candidatus Babeliales bacterium]|jgi:hypothetical protein